MALARNHDLGIFSPLSDASSPADVGSRSILLDNDNRRVQNGQRQRTGTTDLISKRFLHPTAAANSISKIEKRSAIQTESQRHDVISKRVFHLEPKTGGKWGVFSPDSDGGSDIISPYITMTRGPSAAVTSTPVVPYSLPTDDLSLSRSNRPVSAASVSSVASAANAPILNKSPASQQQPFTSGSSKGVNHGTENDSTSTGAVANAGHRGSIGFSKSTQTNPSELRQSPARKSISSTAQSIQADFVRNVVEDCLDEFREDWRQDCYALFGKLLGLVTELEARVENTIGMERLDYMRRLSEENESLRAENERLKAIQFGKFLGSG